MRADEVSRLFEQPNAHGDVPDAPTGAMPTVPAPPPGFAPPAWRPDARSAADDGVSDPR